MVQCGGEFSFFRTTVVFASLQKYFQTSEHLIKKKKKIPSSKIYIKILLNFMGKKSEQYILLFMRVIVSLDLPWF